MPGGRPGIGRAFLLAFVTAGACTTLLARSQSEVAKIVETIEQTEGRGNAFATEGTHTNSLGWFLPVRDDFDVLPNGQKNIEGANLSALRARTRDIGGRSSASDSIRAEAERHPGYSVDLERTFEAPRARVFEAWTEPDSVKKWFVYGAPVHWSQDPTMDARPGGQYNWIVASDDNDLEVFAFHGTYREVKSAEKLVFSWEWQTLPIDGVQGPGNTLVMIEFLQQGRTTRVVLRQVGLPSEAARIAHGKGWQRCFDGIAKLLS